jgi:hypothetical protein
MNARLLNVRLDGGRVRKVQYLRERGVSLSDVVRDAIDRHYDAVQASIAPANLRALVAGLFERFPDPPDQLKRDYDVHDARAARAAVRRRLGPARP